MNISAKALRFDDDSFWVELSDGRNLGDALVYCGPELPPDALLLENPIIVVEVASPSTGRNDATRKLAGYFSLASILHYLIIYPNEASTISASTAARF
jgi:Uma2 family endonuclease